MLLSFLYMFCKNTSSDQESNHRPPAMVVPVIVAVVITTIILKSAIVATILKLWSCTWSYGGYHTCIDSYVLKVEATVILR